MIRDNKIDGIGSILGGEYGTVSIEGIGKIKGNVNCHELIVEGLYKGKGKVQTGNFSCEGLARIFKDMKAKHVKIEGLVKFKGAKLEAEQITCEGMLTCTGEISADEIFIDGICSVAKMYGEVIKIRSVNVDGKVNLPRSMGFLTNAYMGRRVSANTCLVDVIECTELEADHLESKVIKAHSVKLGPGCKVGRIECDGVLEYDESCQIGKIIAGETRTQSYKNNVIQGEIEMADIKLTKILDMYKDNKINADEAEKMLKGIGKLGESVGSQEAPRFSDDKLRVVVMKGNKLISQKEYAKGMTINVEYQGEIGNVECWGNLNCTSVRGNVTADGNIKTDSVGGNVNADGNVECGSVSGNVKADGNVKCGNVSGNITADGNVTCGDVSGKIKADGEVSIKK